MTQQKYALHPRNPHQGRYDLAKLCLKHPALSPFIVSTPAGLLSIDFSNPAAVQALNAAILASEYNVKFWQLPEGYLCPPIPGRADYLHYAADLVAELSATPQQRLSGKQVKLLDIGCGANCIYPILAARSFGWQVLGSDIDRTALAIAQTIVNANPSLKSLITLKLQTDATKIFAGIVQPHDYYDLVVCNPPFYSSSEEAAAVNQQKWQKLGKQDQGRNFAGSNTELWCEGGELRFISNMIIESQRYANQVGWFTSLVSQQKHHKQLVAMLKKLTANPTTVDIRQIRMHQGQKSSLLLAWRFTG